ncbi:thioesterase-like superfamily-domain-containing protein [Chaetomidium leptoderma]|uniref:Thioesterase-like superfamily-domain-containing protein n=1 Tax=Chaetomidium leptoderma TaxID=669021 RepID=A0AAN7A256_9PEZI|nr:thioesterase-like superfamily-domain-containing protein [Chaetomidium leptoderma]
MTSLLPPARLRVAQSVCRRASATSSSSSSSPSYLSLRRPFSASTSRSSSSSTTTPESNKCPFPAPSPRWIAELRTRVGKCLAFGCNDQQVSQAAEVLRAIATDWKELQAGSEGFLSGGRRGLDGRQIAWGEMDSFGHVNNVNYYRYAESARVNWITNFAVHVDPKHRKQWRELMSPKSTGLIMRSLKADFKFPMVYPDKISVYHRLRSKPERDPAPSSFSLDCIVLSHRHRRVACRLQEDIVLYDYRQQGKASMPGFMLDQFEKTWELQEQETLRARMRIFGLHGAVADLESETWNRPDAVEDMGASKASK